MYTAFYGLRELPFELSPDPKYLLLTPHHREALANLQYGITARKAITLLTGEAGTGKTTLVHAALRSEACRAAQIVHLANPMLTRGEFVEFLAHAFGLSAGAHGSKTALLHELRQVLTSRRAEGVTTALVVDEAQVLSEELLEEVRLLSNIETETEKLLPVVLVGQPELAERLNAPALRQLKQRVSLRCTLGLLDSLETAAYVGGRLRIAGGEPGIFVQGAIAQVHARSWGIPRTISVICDNALVSGFAQGIRRITPEIVSEVCDDLDLAPAVSSAGTASPIAVAAAAVPDAPPAAAVAVTSVDDRLFASFGRKRGFSFF